MTLDSMPDLQLIESDLNRGDGWPILNVLCA